MCYALTIFFCLRSDMTSLELTFSLYTRISSYMNLCVCLCVSALRDVVRIRIMSIASRNAPRL